MQSRTQLMGINQKNNEMLISIAALTVLLENE